jgi:gliding motility-associated-like protein
VIDPQLIASTNSGSTAMIWGHTATYDNAGNIFVGGNGFSPGGLPTTPGAYQSTFGGGNDMALNKYNPDGTQLIFSTYLGGQQSDLPHSMVTGTNGDLYVLGSSQSSDYPVGASAAQAANGGMTDIVITHLSADGTTLVGSTYLGGNQTDGSNSVYANYGDGYRGEINLASNGDVLIASFAQSADFPVTTGCYQSVHGGMQDGIAARLNSTLTTVSFATYFGAGQDDSAYGIVEAQDGTIYVSGSVASEAFSFPATQAEPAYPGGTRQAVLLRFSANGQNLTSGSYVGNYGESQGFFVQINPDGHVLMLVQSANGIPSTPGKYATTESETSIVQYTPDLTQIEWVASTGHMAPSAFLVDNCGRIYASGHGISGTGYETTPDAFYTTNMGFYLFCLDESATTLLFGTYYGNGGSHVDGGTSRFDANGVIYQATCSAGSFPAGPNGSYSANANGGSYDMTVFKIDFEQAPSPFTLPGQTITVCDSLPQDVTFAGAPGNVIHHWWFHDGTTASDANPVHSYDAYGTFEVTYYPELIEGCLIADTVTTTVELIQPEPFIATYDLLQGPTCDDTLFLTVDFTGIADSVSWNFGDGFTTDNQDQFLHFYAVPGMYDVTFYAEDSVCNQDTTFTFQMVHNAQQGAGALYMPNVFTSNGDGMNDTYEVSSGTHTKAEVFESLEYYSIQILNRWGNLVFESSENDPQTWSWDGKFDGLPVDEGVYFYLVEYKGTCIEGVVEEHGFVHVVSGK